ncbi:serine/threonine protein kinase [Blastocystis sp. subtype 4]|uniref:serine/threonine protein kinase n=1 Tax=Blastocystis sp. subtype 4 TaxID=944170 RepID=UPI0007115936|nr:serine/threonine protein kinase [Blastocystis sp. subtype 4]KNB44395.1 serine/threonine protein kinase [Blastocystis sp. subtype 4]|eukprot:XP_014527838.1 serine/threonine protein kinase [Blastocystis sp. subtype 4]
MFGGLRTNFPTRKDFLPPEYWQGGRISSYAVDIWSAIVTLYILVMGVNPFSIHRLDDHMETMSHYHTLPNMTGLSDELTQLLSSCMNPRLTQRLTINQILSSSWFEKYGYNINKIQTRNSVSLDELQDTSEMSIPAKWTEDSMIPLSNEIDSCFCKIMDVMYGGVDFEDSVTFQPTSVLNNGFVSVPSQEAIRLLSRKNPRDSEVQPVECSVCQNKGFFNSEKVDLVGVVGLTRKYMWREER